MNKITYGIVKEVRTCGEASRISYGIAAYANLDDDGTVTVVASVSDISSDGQIISDLVEKCNRLNLSVCHLNDIIEDFIAYNSN